MVFSTSAICSKTPKEWTSNPQRRQQCVAHVDWQMRRLRQIPEVSEIGDARLISLSNQTTYYFFLIPGALYCRRVLKSKTATGRATGAPGDRRHDLEGTRGSKENKTNQRAGIARKANAKTRVSSAARGCGGTKKKENNKPGGVSNTPFSTSKPDAQVGVHITLPPQKTE